MISKSVIEFRNREEILRDLKKLIHLPGYIYCLCMIIADDFIHPIENLETINYREKLNIKEVTLILGYLIQEDIDLSYPSSIEELLNNKYQTYKLLKELHYSFLSVQRKIIQKYLVENSKDNKLPFPETEFFINEDSMQESILYGNDGAYDIQYLEYLPIKYQYDQEWLNLNRNFEIQEVIKIAKEIKSVLRNKATQVHKIDLNNEELINSIKKEIKGKNKNIKLKEFLTHLELIQFLELFNLNQEMVNNEIIKEKVDINWNAFYDNLLDLFIIDIKDINHFKGISHFFNNFGLESKEKNRQFNFFGDFNIINSHPLIPISKNKWFIPLYYLLAESIYESPYYWMQEDENYNSIASHNRGKMSEEVVYNLLKPIYGEENIFKSVKIKESKGKTATDIDVLALLGNRAICIQVKSKKLTLKAKRGEINSLINDFQKAFLDAYSQGLKCRKYIKSNNCEFLDENNKKIILPESINEVYLICVTTENYPAIIHFTKVFHKKFPEKFKPLLITIFDLELLTYYLNDPYELTYYIRQRGSLHDKYYSDNEIVFLGYHLQQKLWDNKNYDNLYIDNDFASIIDKDYYIHKYNLVGKFRSSLLADIKKYNNNDFEKLIGEVKVQRNPGKVDIIFSLLDLSSKTRNDLMDNIRNTKFKTQIDGCKHSFVLPSEDFGISFVSCNTMNKEILENETMIYAHLRKYYTKANRWLGLGTYYHTDNIIDCFYYDTNPWEYNEEDEFNCKKYLDHNNKKIIPLIDFSKVRRNDPCPCGSGKKYKKCCGK